MEKPTLAADNTQKDTNNSGCLVDWSWLNGRKLTAVTSDLQTMTLTFEDGQTLKIQALTYKGEAFLSFQPYKDPKAGPDESGR